MKTKLENRYYELCGELTYNELYGGKPSHSTSWTGRIKLQPDSAMVGYIQDDSENSYPKLVIGYYVVGQGFIACLFDETKNTLPSVFEAFAEERNGGTMSGTIENHSSTKLGSLTNISSTQLSLSPEQEAAFDEFVNGAVKKIEQYGNMTALSDLEMFSKMPIKEVKKYLQLHYQALNGQTKGKVQSE